jgi:hypothetical protein
MLPLMFLVFCGLGFTIVGLIALAVIPELRLTFSNLFLFVGGAIPSALLFLFVYGRIFARTQLSDMAFIGIFPVLLVGGVLGGLLLVRLKTRLIKRR